MIPSLVLQRTRRGTYQQREIAIEVCPHVEGRPELAPFLALTRVGTMDYWCVGGPEEVDKLIHKLMAGRGLLEACEATQAPAEASWP